MCQFLILAKDIGSAGRVSGDPVSVVSDTHIFSENEDKRIWLANGNTAKSWPGLYEIIVIPGMPVVQGQRILEQLIRAAIPGDPEYAAPDAVDRIVVLGPHRWRLGKQDRLPAAMANKLDRDGFVEVPYDVDTLNNYVVDRQVVPADRLGGRTPGDPMDLFISLQPIRYYKDGFPVYG